MKKLLIGLIALILLAGAGFWGVTRYAANRAEAEVEAVFQALRASGRTAQHGTVGFDLFAKTLSIPDIAIQEPDGARIKVGSVIAAGLSNPVKGQIGVRKVEVVNLLVDIPSGPGQAGAQYRVPRLVLDGYLGPDTLMPQEGKDHVALRLALRQLAATRAERLTVPEASVQIEAVAKDGVAMRGTYRDLVFEGLDRGRIARGGFSLMEFETLAPATAPELAVKGKVEGVSVTGIHTAPLLAAVEASDAGGLRTIYEQISTRGYSVTRGDGSTLAVGAISARDIGLDPARLRLARLEELQALSQLPPPLNETDTRRLMEASGDMVRAIGFAEFSLQNVTVTEPTGKATVGAIRLTGQKDGRLDLLDVERLAGEAEGEKPVTLDRLTLRGLNPLPILALSARAPSDEVLPTLDSALTLFRALEGLEISGLKASLNDSDVPLSVGTLKLEWGQFIGLVPTRILMSGKDITGPISEADGAPFSYLTAAGAKQATFAFETALVFDPTARTLRLSPGLTRIETAMALDFDVTLTNVRAEAFEDPIVALAAAQQIAMGPFKVTLTNLGIAELMLKEQAAAAGTTPDALRADIVGQIRSQAKDLSALYPEAGALGETLAAFVEKPGTLILVLTPLGDVKVMDLIGGDPLTLVRDFKITATAAP
ncbi:MAG: hypothetical protein AB1592_03975 [Pseudomonadota bacterium]